MSKKGFTLIELLVVISVVAIASVGTIIVFDKSNIDSNKNELTEKYLRIQRSGLIYLDTNDSWRKQFNDRGYVKMKLFELQNENYIESNLYDDVTLDDIDKNNMIVIYKYTVNDVEAVDTCLLTSNSSCLSSSSGASCNCCQNLGSDILVINGNDCL